MESQNKEIKQDVIELAMCEQEHLILRPNRLYMFVVHKGCKRCEELAKVYETEKE